MKDVQTTGEAFLKKENTQHFKTSNVFILSFLLTWIRIHISNANPDPSDQNLCGSGS